MLMERPPAQDWFESPLGSYLLACEQSYFDDEVADVFGFNAIQLGMPRHDFLRANRMPMRCHIGREGTVRVRADHEQLPILGSCADLVIMPHVLEFSDNPHQILREVTRVLMPEGHLIISGFNPWSLWGARRWIGKDRHEFPWNGQFIALPRLKDWLALLGIEVAAGRMGVHIAPVRSQKWVDRLSLLDPAGDRWWPFAGGVYFLHGIKRVHGTRVITPQWKPALAKSKRLVSVPQRVQEDDRLVARNRDGQDD